MYLCSDEHDEVAYEDDTRHCPVCVVLKDLAALEKELEAKEAEVIDLQQKLDDEKANRE